MRCRCNFIYVFTACAVLHVYNTVLAAQGTEMVLGNSAGAVWTRANESRLPAA